MHGLGKVGEDVSVAYRTYRPEYRHIPPGRRIFYELIRIKKMRKAAPQSPASEMPPLKGDDEQVMVEEGRSAKPKVHQVSEHEGPSSSAKGEKKPFKNDSPLPFPSPHRAEEQVPKKKVEEMKKAKEVEEKKEQEVIKPYNIRVEKFVGSLNRTDEKIDKFLEFNVTFPLGH